MENNYPLPSFQFKVTIDHIDKITFTEVSGLTQEAQVIEYRDGEHVEAAPVKIPGIKKFNNIVLKKGIFKNDYELYEWFENIKKGIDDKRAVTISLVDEKLIEVVTWKVTNAWPVKIEGPSLKSTGNEIAVGSLELTHEGLSLEKP